MRACNPRESVRRRSGCETSASLAPQSGRYSLGHRSAWPWLCDGSPVSGVTPCLAAASRESSDTGAIEELALGSSGWPSCHVCVFDRDRQNAADGGRDRPRAGIRVEPASLRHRDETRRDVVPERFFGGHGWSSLVRSPRLTCEFPQNRVAGNGNRVELLGRG